ARDELRMRAQVLPLLLIVWVSTMQEEWQHVAEVGLIGVRYYQHVVWEVSLMVALIDRWDSVTNTFHMPMGEMTITLEDVYRILQLPILGAQVYSISSEVSEELLAPIFGEGVADLMFHMLA
ncbi:hypothetical protein KI387_031408, partial [Taxus chinensis]